MAKGKNLNPADAYRKAQRKKELKKNRAERAKARDFALVKRDTRDLENEIEKLEASSEISASDKSRLTNLKDELSRIIQKKDEYVKEHPEQRKLVYRARKQEMGEDQKEALPVEPKRNLFNKHGLPQHPERSIYYDPVMNPYGVPPPGMPYIERSLTADEVNSGEDVEDEDIIMPEGPPPGASLEDSESGSDNDIPMPKGPPPGTAPGSSPTQVLVRKVIEVADRADPSSQTPSSLVPPPFLPPLPYMLSGTPSCTVPRPPLPPGYGGAYTTHPGVKSPPLPPPGFFPRRTQSAAVIQDPLSITHQTYQEHHASQLPPRHPSLLPLPHSGTPAGKVHAGAIISAGPELRDLKKEAIAFVPTSLKRKRAAGLPSSSKVNAAPSVDTGSEVTSSQARPDLVGVLKSQFGAVTASSLSGQASDRGLKEPIAKGRDDYQKFVDEMSDLLGPPGGV